MADTPKRSRLKRPLRGEEPTLFGAEAKQSNHNPPTVVLSSNFTIGPLIARGALLPDVLEGEAMSASDASFRLRWCPDSLPKPWVDTLLASARNVIPIAIRLRPGRAVRRVLIPDFSDAVEAICLSDVEGMAFRSEKERERFESLDFSNYDLSGAGINRSVEPSLFEGTADPPTDIGSRSETSAIDDAVRAVRSADCLTGLLAFLLAGSPGIRSWMQGVQRLFAKKAKEAATSWPERIASAALGRHVDASTADNALLNGVVDVLRRYPVEGGWPGEQALAEIFSVAKSCLEPQDERAVKELDRWASRAKDVLASKAEPQSLADGEFVLQRAILLLLLRGDLDALGGGEVRLTESQRPGLLVRGVASAFAATRTGLRAMPARYKTASDNSAPGHWLQYLGEVFLAVLQTSHPPALVPVTVPVPSVTYRPIRTLQGEWISSITSKEVARTPMEVDRGLDRLHAMGQHLGFEFQEYGDNGLVASVSSEHGRARPVYLELIRTDQGSGPMVRFSSPALKMIGVAARARMSRELAVELLKRNAEPSVHCRFAVNDEATEVLVLVDQLLGTLDDAEFLQHMKHVAKVAEEFELSRNLGSVTAS